MSVVKLIYKTYLCTSKQYWLKMRYSTRINKICGGLWLSVCTNTYQYCVILQ